ncbi:hypothetical protein FH972_021150 [Carpinus fangiana]|uniref:DNA mismatch repair proteins mutS family domain-containing protein n=1 Tax=Carpinus fangiana TaxID=176857 RepID=A0A5N6KNH6_9ROSI|nr:hypothetical protein FH972_021150 [Carpinus fangiana]
MRASVNRSPGRRPSSTGTYTYPSTTSGSRDPTTVHSTVRPRTARPRTGRSTIGGIDAQQIICAVSESRGVSPAVGLAFVNLDTCEAVLCQLSDTQTYVRTLQKLYVFAPYDILMVSSAENPKSALFSIIEENLEDLDATLTLLDRKYWAESAGLEYIQQLSFAEDVAAVKAAIAGNYFAVCCVAATLKYIEHSLGKTFAYHSLRIKFEPSEGAMMIDISTIHALELIQNLEDARSKKCLFGMLNQTSTPMGARLLRSNLLQPLTNQDTLELRFDALDELSTKEDMFFGVKQATKAFFDIDKFLSSPILARVNTVLNDDVRYSKSPLDLRNNRTYAVKAGVNGLLDVSRTTYKENTDDVHTYVSELSEEHRIPIEVKFDNVRHFYLRLKYADLPATGLPAVFSNAVKKKDKIECLTIALAKMNAKIIDSHNECLLLSDELIHELLIEARGFASPLFKISEGIAMLDMISAFASLVTTKEYCRPKFDATLGIKNGRHPMKERFQKAQYIPNDVYATQQTRFQIITGCNMSGKSTYIRSIALMIVMAQIGCFVPAQYAAIPIRHQLFARVSMDDSIEANVSTFAAEMRETAFILKNIDSRSIAIIDELGRGTSTRDGLAIAIAIAEALVGSRALIWFATHFTELAAVLSERNGVINLHLAVDLAGHNRMQMLYKVASGAASEQHYGIALARTMPLPHALLDRAEIVAEDLRNRETQRKQTSRTVITQRKRRLVLDLREHLVQAQRGTMGETALIGWLKELQKEFVVRMSVLNDEEKAAAQCSPFQDIDDGRTSQTYDNGTATPSGQVSGLSCNEHTDTEQTGECIRECRSPSEGFGSSVSDADSALTWTNTTTF